MKSETLESELGQSKLGNRTSTLLDLADFNVTYGGQFVGLHVQVAVGQAGCGLHFRKRYWRAWHERGQDA